MCACVCVCVCESVFMRLWVCVVHVSACVCVCGSMCVSVVRLLADLDEGHRVDTVSVPGVPHLHTPRRADRLYPIHSALFTT